MATFIIFTRLSHEGLRSPAALAELSHEVMEQIGSTALTPPGKRATLFLDSHVTTEVWAATEWEKFTGLLRSLPPRLVAS